MRKAFRVDEDTTTTESDSLDEDQVDHDSTGSERDSLDGKVPGGAATAVAPAVTPVFLVSAAAAAAPSSDSTSAAVRSGPLFFLHIDAPTAKDDHKRLFIIDAAQISSSSSSSVAESIIIVRSQDEAHNRLVAYSTR